MSADITLLQNRSQRCVEKETRGDKMNMFHSLQQEHHNIKKSVQTENKVEKVTS